MCSFTQHPVVEAVRTVCGHFFERERFEEYGNKRCIACTQVITWYADVPEEMWGKEVELHPKVVQVKHRPVETHMDHVSLEVGIAKNLICIAAARGDEAFEKWCSSKDSAMVAELNYDQPKKQAWIEGFKKYPILVEKLFQAYDYESHEGIQSFINAFFKEKDKINFEIYNSLTKCIFLDSIHEGVRILWGRSASTAPLDENQVIATAEGGKKIRSLIGLTFALCLIIGLSRRLFGKTA